MEARVQSYINAGLPKAKAESTAKNDKLASVLDKIITNANVTAASKNPKQGNLLLHIATSPQELNEEDQSMLAGMVVDGSIQSQDQLNGEFIYSSSFTLPAHQADLHNRRYRTPQGWRRPIKASCRESKWRWCV